jgi:hypothetical protein
MVKTKERTMMKRFKPNRPWTAVPLALIALGATAGVLYAQPDANDAPKGDNPPNWQNGGRGGRGGNQGNRPNFRNMTPEQRQQFQQQRQDENVRRTLNNAGFTSTTVQDAVIAFANEQDKDRTASEDKVRQLAQAVRNGATDAEIATLLAAVRADAQAAQTKREAALKDLDAKISYTKSPKLEAVLVLLGLTGENLSTGGPGAMGMMGGFGGRGMMGGFGQGNNRRGGRGQNNGRQNNAPNAPDA